MKISSFNKGEKFEKYVENTIFPKENYDLIHRSNSFNQNKDRYAEETLKPDFKFRCKESGNEFYVEAKYRSKANNSNKIELMSLKQFERFKEIQKDEVCPIYILIGYGGLPTNPFMLSLIPIEKIEYLSIYVSILKKFKINKKNIDCKKLKLDKLTNNILDNKKKENKEIEVTNENKNSDRKYKKIFPFIAILLLLISVVFITKNDFFETSPKTKIEKNEKESTGLEQEIIIPTDKEIEKLYVKDGNIHLVYLNDEQKQITFNESDENPLFLNNKGMIVFVRNVKERGQYRDYIIRKKLMILSVDDLLERTITEKKPYQDGNDRSYKIFNIINPVRSFDEKYIYFITEKYATGNELVKVDIQTGKWTELFSAENYELIQKGTYKGLFLIGKSEVGYNGRGVYYKLYDESGEMKKEFNSEKSFNDFKESIN
jgi:hypothetical protein